MSKFREYRHALEKEIKIYYNDLQEIDKIKKLKQTEDYIDEFTEIFFLGEKFDYKDRQLIKSEGQYVYDDFLRSIGLDK